MAERITRREERIEELQELVSSIEKLIREGDPDSNAHTLWSIQHMIKSFQVQQASEPQP